MADQPHKGAGIAGSGALFSKVKRPMTAIGSPARTDVVPERGASRRLSPTPQPDIDVRRVPWCLPVGVLTFAEVRRALLTGCAAVSSRSTASALSVRA